MMRRDELIGDADSFEAASRPRRLAAKKMRFLLGDARVDERLGHY